MNDIDFWSAQLRARQIEEETGLSVREQAEMDLNTWARLTHGKTPAEAALDAFRAPMHGSYAEDMPEPVFTEAVESPGPVSVADMSLQEYAAYRQQVGIGQGRSEGVGIMDGLSSRQALIDGARANTGRTAYSAGNVQEPRRVERVYPATAERERLARLYGNSN